MKPQPPLLFAIDNDDHHALHVGHTRDGDQFFLTTPFEPFHGDHDGCEYVALYKFDANGKLKEALIDSFGSRASLDEDARRKWYDMRLNALGDVSIDRIEIEPFSIEYRGVAFGMMLRTPEDDEDFWAVEAQPGNYMAFFEPWDSGEYDT